MDTVPESRQSSGESKDWSRRLNNHSWGLPTNFPEKNINNNNAKNNNKTCLSRFHERDEIKYKIIIIHTC